MSTNPNVTRNENATVSFLRMFAYARDNKYMRNGRKWYNSTDWSPSNNITYTALGWMFEDLSVDWASGQMPKVNVAKSAIDTLCSKIANQKVRPLFTPRKGTFATRRAIKAVQRFFDDLFYKNHVSQKMALAFEYACVFDSGILWADTWTKSIKAVAPWEVGIVPNEFQFNGFGTKCLITYRNYPCTQLDIYGIDNDPDKTYCTFEIYYDTEKKVTKLFKDKIEVKSKSYNAKQVPILFLHFNEPLLGWRTSALLDDLLPIQQQIDLNISKIKDAAHSTPVNTVFVPEGSDLSVTQLSAGSGNVVPYRPVPGAGTNPIHVATPPPMDNFYLQWHELLKNDAFAMSGISELSSQSIKPAGLDSGKALETMENIESARFEVQLSNVIRSHVELAKLFIDAFDEDDEVLPPEEFRDDITWKDIKKQINEVNIQFTAASSISNDPQEQFELLKNMSQIGLIDESRISELMDLPDAEGAFDDAGALPDAVDKLIQFVLKNPKKEIEIPVFIDYEVLRNKIVLYQNKYFSLDRDCTKEIMRLQELFIQLEPLLDEAGIIAEEEQAETKTADPEAGFASKGAINPAQATKDAGNESTQIDVSDGGIPTENEAQL